MAIDSGPGAMGLFFLFFPPYSVVMYVFGAASVTLMELLIFYYLKVRKISAITKDNIPQRTGLIYFWSLSVVLGIIFPLFIFGVLLIFP